MTYIEPPRPRHGYSQWPKSRAVWCRELGMGGAIQWEPQSVEAPKGFPQAGPPDGELASGGHAKFSALDGVLDPRGQPWPTTAVVRGSVKQFDWWLTASHATTKFEYWCTRSGWNEDAPLTRAQFDADPFLTVQWDASRPAQSVRHWGRMPVDKWGRHVVYGVWTVDDTAMAFYQACDVDFVDG